MKSNVLMISGGTPSLDEEAFVKRNAVSEMLILYYVITLSAFFLYMFEFEKNIMRAVFLLILSVALSIAGIYAGKCYRQDIKLRDDGE